MGVQCGTLRGGGSLAYRTLEGGGGAAPNTLLDVESTAQCTTLVSPTTHWRKGGTVPNSLLTVESTALHLREKAPMLQCCSHITMHCNKQGESSMLQCYAIHWTALDERERYCITSHLNAMRARESRNVSVHYAKRRDILGCATRYISTQGSVQAFSHH